MRVTTRPGAEGVPRWSSLFPCYYQRNKSIDFKESYLAYKDLVLCQVVAGKCVLPAKNAGRSLLCSPALFDLRSQRQPISLESK
jgi:hypothetical protein